MLKHTSNTSDSRIRFYKQMYNNTPPKLQKCWTQKIAFNIISKMLKQPDFFHSQPSTLPKKALLQSFTFRWLLDHVLS